MGEVFGDMPTGAEPLKWVSPKEEKESRIGGFCARNILAGLS